MFENVRETTWRVLALAIAAWLGACALMNFAVGSDVWKAVGEVERATGGWVQMTLLVSLFFFAMMAVVIFDVGGLRCSDIGWRLPAVGTGMLVALGFWVAMQIGLALWATLRGGQLQWNDAWSERGAGRILGELLAQLLGNALVEETVFRGFVLPQFYLKASARFRSGTAMAMALVGSAVLFAFTHIPHRVFVLEWPVEKLLGNQLVIILQGLIFGAVYLVTRNIFICVGLHSLWNQPARLLPVPFSPGVEIVWYALVLILLVVWPLARRLGTQGRAHITEDKASQTPA